VGAEKGEKGGSSGPRGGESSITELGRLVYDEVACFIPAQLEKAGWGVCSNYLESSGRSGIRFFDSKCKGEVRTEKGRKKDNR